MNDNMNMEVIQGDPYRTTYEFSLHLVEDIVTLTIPVLVTYGTKDVVAPFNDFLHIECIRKSKKNIQFNAYIGTEHNFFPLTPEGQPNYDFYNWDKVAGDWLTWLNK